jgi:bifunctional N-acetylglucosamine-1-phosphate-uridyltransferase/glucosamine-1-phosphate-acetyltransferase GlmU-like protein
MIGSGWFRSFELIEMNAYILASGKTNPLLFKGFDLPKSLIEINGNTILDYQIDRFNKAEIDISIIIGYKSHSIIDHCVKKGYRYVKFIFDDMWETEQGIVKTIMGVRENLYSREPIIITYGDLLFNSDLIEALVSSWGDICKVTKGAQIVKFTPAGFQKFIDHYNTFPDFGRGFMGMPFDVVTIPYIWHTDVDNQRQLNSLRGIKSLETCNVI